MRSVYTFLNGKYFFDILYNHYIIGRGLHQSYFISKVLDRGVLEWVGPYGLSSSFKNSGEVISKLDTGVVTTYSLYITLSLLSFVMIVFSPLLIDNSVLSEVRLGIIYFSSLFISLW